MWKARKFRRMNGTYAKHDESLVDFIEAVVQIESPEAGGWIPFTLWDEQRQVARQMQDSRRLVVLKARQLGLTWLALAHALWRMVMHPPATVLLFSLREVEAQELLRRLVEMHARLPRQMQVRAAKRGGRQHAKQWRLANGSRAVAFPTSGGRSWTGTLALVDEADYIPDLGHFLNAVKPTIDAGGQLQLISTADKAQPLSVFKRIYRAARRDENGYTAIFLPWSVRPERTQAWYDAVAAEMRAQRGSDDDLQQEYPATEEEALRVRSLAARIAAAEVEAVTQLASPLTELGDSFGGALQSAALARDLLRIFALPIEGRTYAIGADPAEGNPRSDESAACVLDCESGEQVAILAGRLEPDRFALLCAALCEAYNDAAILVERNNHGHAVIQALNETGVYLLTGKDGKKGFLTTVPTKALLYDQLAQAVREEAIALRDAETAAQLATVDALTLRAPQGLQDDRAMALALAWWAVENGAVSVFYPPIPPEDIFADERRRWW